MKEKSPKFWVLFCFDNFRHLILLLSKMYFWRLSAFWYHLLSNDPFRNDPFRNKCPFRNTFSAIWIPLRKGSTGPFSQRFFCCSEMGQGIFLNLKYNNFSIRKLTFVVYCLYCNHHIISIILWFFTQNYWFSWLSNQPTAWKFCVF